jgi:type I pantothenate kinase
MLTPGYEPLADAVRELVRAAAGHVVVVGVAGAVCVGKTTTSEGLARMLDPISTEIVTTDGFLLPGAELERRGLIMRKGFPESYDEPAIRSFLTAVRRGTEGVVVPVYSHEIYDVVPGDVHGLRDAAVVIVEGVNALRFVDQLDLAVYIDAPEPVVEAWYVERFLHLCAVAAPATFYANFAGLDDAGRRVMAHQVWGAVNRQNLADFIQPTRDVATVVVEKQSDHTVQRIRFAGSRQ